MVLFLFTDVDELQEDCMLKKFSILFTILLRSPGSPHHVCVAGVQKALEPLMWFVIVVTFLWPSALDLQSADL